MTRRELVFFLIAGAAILVLVMSQSAGNVPAWIACVMAAIIGACAGFIIGCLMTAAVIGHNRKGGL